MDTTPTSLVVPLMEGTKGNTVGGCRIVSTKNVRVVATMDIHRKSARSTVGTVATEDIKRETARERKVTGEILATEISWQ